VSVELAGISLRDRDRGQKEPPHVTPPGSHFVVELCAANSQRSQSAATALCRSTSPAMESLEPRQLLIAVASDPGDLQVTTEISVEFTDDAGRVITQVQHHDSFQINIFVRDIREVPQGVVSAFVDVSYDTNVIDVTNIVHHHQLGADGRIDDQAGIVDDAGGARLEPSASLEAQLLLSLSATAIKPCEITVQTRAADGADTVSALARLDTDQRERTVFGQATLTVAPHHDTGPAGRYDLDGNGRISFGDLAFFAPSFGKMADTSCQATMSHFDGNGLVGFGDVVQLADVFGQPVDVETTGQNQFELTNDDDVDAQSPQAVPRSIAAQPAAAVINDAKDSTTTAAQSANVRTQVLTEIPRPGMLTATCPDSHDAETCGHQDDEVGPSPDVDETNTGLATIPGDVVNGEIPSP